MAHILACASGQYVRAILSRRLDLPVSDEPIHVFLFRRSEQYNDFIRENFPKLPSRRAFFIETDTRLSVYAYWGDRVAEDLRHEVAHGYIHAVVPTIPLWLDEGLAEYFEVPRGNMGLNQPHIELLTQSLTDSSWQPDLQRLESLAEAGEMTQLDYAESWLWAHMLLESSDGRREFLHGYLDRLREQGTTIPFSVSLREFEMDASANLADHLRSVAQRS